MKKKKIKYFCRLYKYTCCLCLRKKHKRHFAKKEGETCDTCAKLMHDKAIRDSQPSLFDIVQEPEVETPKDSKHFIERFLSFSKEKKEKKETTAPYSLAKAMEQSGQEDTQTFTHLFTPNYED